MGFKPENAQVRTVKYRGSKIKFDLLVTHRVVPTVLQTAPGRKARHWSSARSALEITMADRDRGRRSLAESAPGIQYAIGYWISGRPAERDGDRHTGGMSVSRTMGPLWRWFSSGLLATAFLTTGAACAGSSPASSSSNSCNGVTLNAAFLSGGPYDQIFTHIPDWQKQTGGTVNVVIKGSGGNFFPSVLQALATGSPALDVTSEHTSFYQQAIAYLTPLDSYFSKSDLSPFYPSMISASSANGHLWLIPRHLDVGVLYYRTDLFNDPKEQAAFQAKYGYALAPPATYAQFKDIAEFFTRASQGLVGTSLPGKAEEPLLGRFNELLVSFGGQFLSSDGKSAAFNSTAGTQALQYIRDLYAAGAIPSATANMSFGEQDNLFANGKSAFVDNFPYAWSIYTDPKQSKVASNVGIADNPAGPSGHVSWGAAHGWAVAKRSQHAGCAASLIKFLTSPSVMLSEVKLGFLPPRSDVAQMLSDQTTDAQGNARLQLYQKIVANEFLAVPPTPQWVPLANKLTPIIQQVMLGDVSVQDGLNKMSSQANDLLKQ